MRASSLLQRVGLSHGFAVAVLAYAGGCPAIGEERPREIVVMLDRATIEPMAADAQTLVLGNPLVADITLLKRTGQMVITGKGFGITNLIVLDGAGHRIGESIVRVTSPPGLLTVQRGMERESYACVGRCEPTVALGDSAHFTSDVAGQIGIRNGLSSGQPAK